RPRTVSRVAISVGAMDQVQLKVILRPADGGAERTAVTTFGNRPALPSFQFAIPGGAVRAKSLRLEILQVGAETCNMEIREVSFQ
ncbi:MAG TPA: hypothetical protein VK780_09480, partial [Thermoanaerobaculia bacterium]|nr:hypothetical protein [Thermoanaerobaculia bacterium]